MDVTSGDIVALLRLLFSQPDELVHIPGRGKFKLYYVPAGLDGKPTSMLVPDPDGTGPHTPAKLLNNDTQICTCGEC